MCRDEFCCRRPKRLAQHLMVCGRLEHDRVASSRAAALALAAIALLTSAANAHASIDAKQFCNRTAQMQIAILEQLPGARAT